MATSYNGWFASSNPDAIGVNPDWEPIPGHRFPGGIRGGDVEEVFTYLVVQLDARVEPIEHYAPGDEWGYFFKFSANSPSLLSCHSSATAIDYNATRHPNGVRGTWTAQQVAEIREILAELDGVIHWLYDATGTPDEMHFETRASQAQVTAVANKLRWNSQPAPTPPPADEEEEMASFYLWLRDTRVAGKDYIRYNNTATVPKVNGSHCYRISDNGEGVYQTAEALALAGDLSALTGKELEIVGSASSAKASIVVNEDGSSDYGAWFSGCHLIDGPLAGIKK